jgi:hypothetical protein
MKNPGARRRRDGLKPMRPIKPVPRINPRPVPAGGDFESASIIFHFGQPTGGDRRLRGGCRSGGSNEAMRGA